MARYKHIAPSDPRRKALLAKIHIAKKDLGLDELIYRDCIQAISRGRTTTAAELGLRELEDLVRHFKRLGWHEGPSHTRKHKKALIRQIKTRAKAYLGSNWEARLNGLQRRILSVDRLEWAHPAELKRLLAVMKSIGQQEAARSVT